MVEYYAEPLQSLVVILPELMRGQDAERYTHWRDLSLEAGLPEGWLSVIPGPGAEVGNAIVEHELTRAITFTGSAQVGWDIRSRVPAKKVNLELGSNAPLIVHADGDWETGRATWTVRVRTLGGDAPR